MGPLLLHQIPWLSPLTCATALVVQHGDVLVTRSLMTLHYTDLLEGAFLQGLVGQGTRIYVHDPPWYLAQRVTQ